MSRDPTNGMVLTRYALMSEPSGLSSVRNTSAVLSRDPFYDPRVQPFWTGAINARKATFLRTALSLNSIYHFFLSSLC